MDEPIIRMFGILIEIRKNNLLVLTLRVAPTIESPSFHGQIYLRPHLGIVDEFLDSRKKFEKSSHGPKLSQKWHEKVNAD